MKQSMAVPVTRPEVRHFAPYIPGRPITEVQRRYGLATVYKLASNENAMGCSPKVRAVVRSVLGGLSRYPEGSSQMLRERLARLLRVSPAEVIIGAGSDELIELIGKTYLDRRDDIVVSEHAFIRYRMAGELMGCRIISVPMRAYTHDLRAMAAAVGPKTKAVFIANPNNPTGTYNTHRQLEGFLRDLRTAGRCPLVVVDEAYHEYARTHPDYALSLKLRAGYPNMIVLRTFSKAYGLAGLRVGYGVSRPEIIADLDRVRPPFNVSIFGQYLATAACDDQVHIRRTVSQVAREKRRVGAALQRLGCPCLPSAANFLLFDVSPRRGKDVFDALMAAGVIVRSMDEYGLPHHVRVTVGTRRENDAFLRALPGALRSTRS